jgi:Recombinase
VAEYVETESDRRTDRPQLAKALAHAKAIGATVEDLRSQGITSVRRIAAQLNARGILTPRGGSWHPTSVARLHTRISSL